jgi:hypothetical protein
MWVVANLDEDYIAKRPPVIGLWASQKRIAVCIFLVILYYQPQPR